jgi:hypothetical protein
MPMNVYISNPERKKERTDHDANEREIYVAGLSKFTKKEDLEKLFKTVCYLSKICFASIDILTDVEILVWYCQGSADG